MARTINEIYQAIIASKDSNTSLSSLNSTSSFGIANSIFWICATAISIHEQIYDVFTSEIEAKKAVIHGQTGLWWNDKMINSFQFDPTDTDKSILVIDDNLNYYYPVVDATKRIIKYSATSAVSRQVTIKVAKDDGSGNPAQLTSDELLAALSFVNSIQDAGTLINTISLPADLLLVNFNIYFNAQYGQATVLSNVKIAIQTYLQNLRFDGVIQILKLIDQIETVPGVTDILLVSAQAKSEADAYQLFDRQYFTKAGYAQLNVTDSIFNMIVQN